MKPTVTTFSFLLGLAGLLAGVAFVLWELRQAHPLLDPRLFRNRGFAAGTLTMTVQFFAAFGFLAALAFFTFFGPAAFFAAFGFFAPTGWAAWSCMYRSSVRPRAPTAPTCRKFRRFSGEPRQRDSRFIGRTPVVGRLGVVRAVFVSARA